MPRMASYRKHTTVHAFGAAAWACLVCAIGLAGCGPQTAMHVEGVPVFAKVSDGLYRGGQPSAAGLAGLKDLGIKTVISLRDTDSDSRDVSSAELRYLQVPFNPVHPEEQDVLTFLKAATDPNNTPVFVHCMEGLNRTGMMVAMYRMVVEGWSRDKALAEMRAMGYQRRWLQIGHYARHADVARLKQQLASVPPPPVEVFNPPQPR